MVVSSGIFGHVLVVELLYGRGAKREAERDLPQLVERDGVRELPRDIVRAKARHDALKIDTQQLGLEELQDGEADTIGDLPTAFGDEDVPHARHELDSGARAAQEGA